MIDSPNQIPRRLILEESLAQSPLARSLTERFQKIEQRPGIGPSDYTGYGRGDLVLAGHRGEFVKPCPGMKGYNCCGLQIVHFGLGCRIDCTYCILQDFLDTEALVVFGNIEEGLDRLTARLGDPEYGPKRFCTGEFTDSLLLEPLTGYGAKLVKIFARFPGRVLELKTKTTNVDSLLDLDHGGRTVISFSLNAPLVVEREERRAPPLKARLAAAAKAIRAGYRVGFHFDPLIRHAGWEEGYRQTVEAMFQAVPADKIAWISMGAFRHTPGLKEIIRRRHPESKITFEEFIPAGDGKMRYLRPLRVEMYARMLELIHSHDPKAAVYMCMESPRVWKEVFGNNPGSEGLTGMLDERVE